MQCESLIKSIITSLPGCGLAALGRIVQAAQISVMDIAASESRMRPDLRVSACNSSLSIIKMFLLSGSGSGYDNDHSFNILY